MELTNKQVEDFYEALEKENINAYMQDFIKENGSELEEVLANLRKTLETDDNEMALRRFEVEVEPIYSLIACLHKENANEIISSEEISKLDESIKTRDFSTETIDTLIRHGCKETLSKLVSMGYDVGYEVEEYHPLEVIQTSIDKMITPKEEMLTFLLEQKDTYSKFDLETFIKAGASPDELLCSILESPTKNDGKLLENVKFLVEEWGANTNYEKEDSLYTENDALFYYEHHHTPLKYLVEAKSSECHEEILKTAEYLLNEGADANYYNSLMLSARKDEELFSLLEEYGGVIRSPYDGGLTPPPKKALIHPRALVNRGMSPDEVLQNVLSNPSASGERLLQNVKILVEEYGVNVNNPDAQSKESPLKTLIESNYRGYRKEVLETMEYLLNEGANPNHFNSSPMEAAMDDKEVENLLRKYGGQFCWEYETAPKVQKKDRFYPKALVYEGKSPISLLSDALEHPDRSGDRLLENVKYLVEECGVDINPHNPRPFSIYYDLDHKLQTYTQSYLVDLMNSKFDDKYHEEVLKTMEYLIQKGVDVHWGNDEAVVAAASRGPKGDVKMAEMLHEYGADFTTAKESVRETSSVRKTLDNWSKKYSKQTSFIERLSGMINRSNSQEVAPKDVNIENEGNNNDNGLGLG